MKGGKRALPCVSLRNLVIYILLTILSLIITYLTVSLHQANAANLQLFREVLNLTENYQVLLSNIELFHPKLVTGETKPEEWRNAASNLIYVDIDPVLYKMKTVNPKIWTNMIGEEFQWGYVGLESVYYLEGKIRVYARYIENGLWNRNCTVEEKRSGSCLTNWALSKKHRLSFLMLNE